MTSSFRPRYRAAVAMRPTRPRPAGARPPGGIRRHIVTQGARRRWPRSPRRPPRWPTTPSRRRAPDNDGQLLLDAGRTNFQDLGRAQVRYRSRQTRCHCVHQTLGNVGARSRRRSPRRADRRGEGTRAQRRWGSRDGSQAAPPSSPITSTAPGSARRPRCMGDAVHPQALYPLWALDPRHRQPLAIGPPPPSAWAA